MGFCIPAPPRVIQPPCWHLQGCASCPAHHQPKSSHIPGKPGWNTRDKTQILNDPRASSGYAQPGQGWACCLPCCCFGLSGCLVLFFFFLPSANNRIAKLQCIIGSILSLPPLPLAWVGGGVWKGPWGFKYPILRLKKKNLNTTRDNGLDFCLLFYHFFQHPQNFLSPGQKINSF